MNGWLMTESFLVAVVGTLLAVRKEEDQVVVSSREEALPVCQFQSGDSFVRSFVCCCGWLVGMRRNCVHRTVVSPVIVLSFRESRV